MEGGFYLPNPFYIKAPCWDEETSLEEVKILSKSLKVFFKNLAEKSLLRSLETSIRILIRLFLSLLFWLVVEVEILMKLEFRFASLKEVNIYFCFNLVIFFFFISFFTIS